MLALAARIESRPAFILAASALAIDGVLLFLIGGVRRWAVLTYPAITSIVTASYVVLLSVGKGDPAMAYVLGLNAVLQALVLWPIGEVCRRSRGEWTKRYAPPLFHSAVALTFLAVVPAYASPVTMVLVAVSFLLAIKGLPSAGWIYPAAAAIGLALYVPWLSHLSRPGLLAACVAGAYVLWAAGEVLRRHGEGLCELLGLKPLDYGAPPFNLAAGLVRDGLPAQVRSRAGAGRDVTAHAWVPLVLAPLSLGLLRAYPRREVVHVCLLLMAWGTISVIAPSLMALGFMALALLVVSAGFQAIEPAIRANERAIGRLTGMVPRRSPRPFGPGRRASGSWAG